MTLSVMPMAMPALAPGLRPDDAAVDGVGLGSEETVGVVDDAAVDLADLGPEEAVGAFDDAAID